MIVDVSLRPSARLTRHHRGEHKIRLYRAATIGWSQPFVDCSNEDGGLETDRKFVEAAGHRPVPFQAVDSALNRVPGLVVLTVEGWRPPAGLPAALAVARLVGGFRNRAPDPALSQVGPVGSGRIRFVAPHSQRADTGTARPDTRHSDAVQDGGELGTVSRADLL